MLFTDETRLNKPFPNTTQRQARGQPCPHSFPSPPWRQQLPGSCRSRALFVSACAASAPSFPPLPPSPLPSLPLAGPSARRGPRGGGTSGPRVPSPRPSECRGSPQRPPAPSAAGERRGRRHGRPGAGGALRVGLVSGAELGRTATSTGVTPSGGAGWAVPRV